MVVLRHTWTQWRAMVRLLSTSPALRARKLETLREEASDRLARMVEACDNSEAAIQFLAASSIKKKESKHIID